MLTPGVQLDSTLVCDLGNFLSMKACLFNSKLQQWHHMCWCQELSRASRSHPDQTLESISPQGAAVGWSILTAHIQQKDRGYRLC